MASKRNKEMTLSEAGKLGAVITNKILTTEKRRAAARKGWKLRWARLKNKKVLQ